MYSLSGRARSKQTLIGAAVVDDVLAGQITHLRGGEHDDKVAGFLRIGEPPGHTRVYPLMRFVRKDRSTFIGRLTTCPVDFEGVPARLALLTDETQRREYEQHRAAWLAARGAIDCPKCGAPNRVHPGAGMRCGRCKAQLSTWTPSGRLRAEGQRLAEGAAASGEQFLHRTIDLMSEAGAEAGKELTRMAMKWLRERMDLHRTKE